MSKKYIVSSIMFILLFSMFVSGFSIDINSPLTGDYIGDTDYVLSATVTINYSENINVTNVTFTYDSGTVACYNDTFVFNTTSDFTCSWDTSGINGNFTINATAVNFSGISENSTTISNVIVDTTPTNIDLNIPTNEYNSSSANVDFNWTATDNLDTNLTCNLTIDGVVNVTAIDSLNATSTQNTVNGLSDGPHIWNVTCIDDGGNVNISARWTVYVDATGPIVNLNAPDNYSSDGDGTVTFNYTGTDVNIDSCILYGNFGTVLIKKP